MGAPLRLLQLVADTDAGTAQSRALALHKALAERGQEVRTLAVAPGRSGELAATLPVLAPGRRSVAALTAVRAEARWADVVLFHDVAALPPGIGWLRSLPRVVLVSEGDPDDRRLHTLPRLGEALVLRTDPARPGAPKVQHPTLQLPEGSGAAELAELLVAHLSPR
jgi:hypothetical protein